MHPKAIPDEYQMATPYLVCENAAKAIEFYIKAFGAREAMRIEGPGGAIGHAEVRIGAAAVMLTEACDRTPMKSPLKLGSTSVMIYIYVPDVDALAAQAAAAGAEILQPCKDQFYGDRSCTLRDPFGHLWGFATHKEDVTMEELHKRASAMRPPS